MLVALAVGTYNGTPGGVTTAFDCKVRTLAWQYGKQLAPQRQGFKSLFDALQLNECPQILNPPTVADGYAPPLLPTIIEDANASLVLYVDADRGDDANTGAFDRPLRTVEVAVLRSRSRSSTPSRHLVLRGKHYLPSPIELTSADSGLHLRNHNGEPAELTGVR